MSKFVFFALSLITSMAFFCFSCTDDHTDAPRLERIAKAYCDCVAASDLQTLNDKVLKDMTAEEAGLLFENLQKEDDKVRECTGTIKANLGKVLAPEMDSLKKILPPNCPEVAKDAQFMREHLGM